MASIKELKKDINYLIDEVIGTCMLHQYLIGNEKQKELDALIDELINYREALIQKVNNPDTEEGKRKLRSYYRSLQEELVEKVNASFEQIHGLTQ